MSTKRIVTALLAVCIAFSFPLTSFADDTENASEETVEIQSLDDFIQFSQRCTISSYSENKTFVLKCNLDLSGTDFEPVPCFLGTFNGNGHTISGLNVSRDGSRQGLFRIVEEGAVITDLKVSGNVTPGGTQCFIGGIAGFNNGKIESCSFEGTAEGIDDIGGIAGINSSSGIIISCSSKGAVNGEHRVGGIAGSNDGIIENCTNSSKVNTKLITPQSEFSLDISSFTNEDFLDIVSIGGICGVNKGSVYSSKNTADIGYKNVAYNVGGIAGLSYGYVQNCSNTGDVLGRKDVGGICGQLVPYTELDLDTSKMDNLQNSINILNAKIDTASVATQDQSGEVSQEMERMRAVTGNLTDEIQYVYDQIESGGPVDTSGLSQAMTEFSAEYEIMSMTLQNMTEQFSDSFADLSAGMTSVLANVSSIVKGANGEILEINNISVEKAYEINEGAIDSCENKGTIQSDSNAGGITGNVAYEISFDMEDTLNAKDYLLSDAREYIFAAVRNCRSFGCVETKNNNSGCIAGNCDVGVIIDCTGAGSASSVSGDYVGGISGNNLGTIKNCISRVVLSGVKYIGGIAGFGTELIDCRAYTAFDSFSEYAGAVAGYCDGNAEGNLYVDSYPAGIDGISYTGKSDPVSYEQLVTSDSEELLVFDDIVVRFIGPDGKCIKSVDVQFGDAVTELPDVPMDGEKFWKWDTDELNAVYYSIDVIGKYYNPMTTLSTPEEVPLILVEGQFYEGQELIVEPYSADGLENLICGYTVEVSDYDRELFVRMFAEENGTLYILQPDGSLEKVQYSTDGRYKTFNLDNSGSFVYAKKTDQKSELMVILIVVLALIVVSAFVYLIIRKNKLNKENKEVKEKDDETGNIID